MANIVFVEWPGRNIEIELDNWCPDTLARQHISLDRICPDSLAH
jgi:hypothetical protein